MSVGSALRSIRDRALGSLIRQVAADSVAEVKASMAEIERILGYQGDAADEVAETIGRTLTRLTSELTALTAEVARLNERLERLEVSDSAASRS